MTDIAGRVAFVTGAAGGIGSALARALLAAGARVALADIDPARIVLPDTDDGAGGRRTSAIALDVSDPVQWDAALATAEATLGPVSILVNNAGLGQFGHVATESAERWRRTFEVNAFGPFHGCRAALPRMLARGSGHLVIVASESGMQGSAGLAAYTASKHAAVGLARSLRLELADTGVGISLVCPGMVRTGLVVNSMDRIASDTHAAAPDTELRAHARAALEQGMDPDKVAARIVDAVRNDEFYVFTHPAFADTLASQGREMLAATVRGADPHYVPPDLSAFRARAGAGDRQSDP